MTVVIRPVSRDDAQALGEIHATAWLVAYRGLMTDEFLDQITVERRAARWEETLSGETWPLVRVAERNGVLVGFCITERPTRDDDADGTVAEIGALNVRPDAWRTGVGAALMRDALNDLKADGWLTASLWVVDGNERAQNFYRWLGFELDGARKTHPPSGASEVRMRLLLSDASAV